MLIHSSPWPRFSFSHISNNSGREESVEQRIAGIVILQELTFEELRPLDIAALTRTDTLSYLRQWWM